MTDDKWEFHPDGLYDGRFFFNHAWEYIFSDVIYFRSDPDGWIDADHAPPSKGPYLTVSSCREYWDIAHWDGEDWLVDDWSVDMWKPVILPEKPEPKKRFDIDLVEYNSDRFNGGYLNVISITDHKERASMRMRLTDDEINFLSRVFKSINKELS